MAERAEKIECPGDTLRRAQSLFSRGHAAAALEEIERALVPYPDDGRLWEWRAIVLYSQKKWSLALAAAERACCLVPLGYAAQLAMADGYSHTGLHKSAVSLYEFLLEREDLPVGMYAKLSSGFGRAGKWQLALAACRQAAQLEPECDEALFGMAYYMGRMGHERHQIAAVLRRALNLAPEKMHYRATLTRLLLEMGAQDEAYQTLAKATPAQLCELRCKHCLVSLLRLCVDHGDEARSATLACHLSRIGQRPSTPGRVSHDD